MPRGLSRAGIVAAALDVLDEAGLDGVTVRAVAARLGVQAPALYWHVRDKQDLLDEMGTQIWRGVTAEMAAGPADRPWDEAMTAVAGIVRRALLAHRDGAKVFTGTYLTDPGVLEAQEAGFARLEAEGFTVASAIRAYTLLYSFTVGFCIEEQAGAQAGDDRYSLRRRAERVDAPAHPRTAQAGPELFGPPDERFAGLVAVIVEAVGRMRTGPAGPEAITGEYC